MKRGPFFRILFLILFTPFSLIAESQNSPRTPGYIDLQFFSRIFDLPLFGENSPASVRFLGTQLFANGTQLSGWADTGFPNPTTSAGVELSQIPFHEARMSFRGGDFSYAALRPSLFSATLQESIGLQGIGFDYRSGKTQWGISGGRTKYEQELPDANLTTRPTLFTAEVLHRIGTSYLGLSAIRVQNPVFAEEIPQMESTILAGSFIQQFTPNFYWFNKLYKGGDAIGGITGVRHAFQQAEMNFKLYSFGDQFPYLPPLFRPGEEGAEFSGHLRLSEFIQLYGRLNYYNDDLVQLRQDFRGDLGLGWSLGSNRPNMQFNYFRNQINFELLETDGAAFISDRVSFSLSQTSTGSFSHLRLDHLLASDSHPSRSQVTFDYRRIYDYQSSLYGSVVAQKEESQYGMTGETSIEKPWNSTYYYLLGIGAAYVNRNGHSSGEAVAKLGVSRRIFRSGWSARLELALPFSIGLQRSNLGHRQLLFHLGRQIAWENLDRAKEVFSPSASADQYGSIHGSVKNEAAGIRGVDIFVNGEQRATTSSNGSFSIKRVTAGTANISVNTRSLDPKLSVLGGPSREITVTAGQETKVEFAVADLRYFQGSVLICRNGRKAAPLENIQLELMGENYSNTTSTTSLGGFQFDEIPPGVYSLSFKPGIVSEDLKGLVFPKYGVVLMHDVLGYVIRLNCNVPN